MSNVRNAVATTEAAQAPAVADPAEVSPAQMIRISIERQSEAFRQILPAHVDEARFSRVLLSAIKSTPQLMECFETKQGEISVLLAAMEAAAMGLEPNTPTKECWLLPRRNGRVMEAQLSIGYRGIIKLARRSGNIKTIFAQAVREKDHFEWSRGLESDHLEFKPYDGPDDPGELTHAFAVARFVDGGYAFKVANKRDVEKRRAMSDSYKNERARPYSPWTKWTEEQWQKTAIRMLENQLELSPEIARHLSTDEARLELSDEGVIEARYVPEEDELPVPPAGELEQPQNETSPDPASGDGQPAHSPAPAAAPGDGSAAVPGATSPADFTPATEGQARAINSLLKAAGVSGDDRFPVLAEYVGRPVAAVKDLSSDEAGAFIEARQQTAEAA